MLVLTRKKGQRIVIGKDIVITVLHIQGDQISLGIEAPKTIDIVREELLKNEAICQGITDGKKSDLL